MKTIEYFYSAHSAFAYLGSERLMEVCRSNGCKLLHRPVSLRPVIEAAGGLPVVGRTKAHVDYFFGREIERWAEFRQVPVIAHRPTHHDNPLDLPNGMLIAAIERNVDVDALAHAILQAHWRDDADLADADALSEAAISVGIDPAPLIEAALTLEIQAIHQANTDEAVDRGIFGSPTYFVDNDMFYGQDRLEFLERALTQPFKYAGFENP